VAQAGPGGGLQWSRAAGVAVGDGGDFAVEVVAVVAAPGLLVVGFAGPVAADVPGTEGEVGGGELEAGGAAESLLGDAVEGEGLGAGAGGPPPGPTPTRSSANPPTSALAWTSSAPASTTLPPAGSCPSTRSSTPPARRPWPVTPTPLTTPSPAPTPPDYAVSPCPTNPPSTAAATPSAEAVATAAAAAHPSAVPQDANRGSRAALASPAAAHPSLANACGGFLRGWRETDYSHALPQKAPRSATRPRPAAG
jgi:hypothetical protein